VRPQDRYRRLVDLSPYSIFIVQGDRIVLVNPAAVRLMGADDADQLLGRSAYDLFHPDAREEVREQVATLLSGHPVPSAEQKIVRSDGALTDVEVVSTMIDDDDGRAVQMILRDITQRKQMLGYAEDEIEPHVRAWERLLHPEDMPRAQQIHEGVVRGERTYEGEFRLRHKNGHYVDVLSRGYPVRRGPGGPVVRIVGTHFDLTARRQADAERTRSEILRRMVFAQEDERRRIAREMHDQFGEQLTALALRIAALKAACGDRPDLREQVEALDEVAKQIDRDVDQLVWELRPTALDDLGLRAAVANYVQEWSRRAHVEAALHTSGLLDQRLPSEVETTLYRIAQEALTNVAKHARATHVEILLERRADHVLLIVEDDGVGFEPAATEARQGFGLLGMQERAALVGATLEIESTGRGTTVLVRMAAPPAGE
jgi:PAS domain S-box-containing protein